MTFFNDIADHLEEKDIYFIGTHEKQDINVLFPEEKESILNAVQKRQIDFATGRWCARKALEKLNIEPQPVLSGEERRPIWPDNITGSISHTNNGYCSAVASCDKYSAIGMDVENSKVL